MIKIAGVVFLIVFIFLVFFRPFNIEETEHRYPYIITVFIQAFCSSLVFLLTIATFNGLVGKKVEEHWTVLREIGLLCVVFFMIGFGNFLVRNFIYNNPKNFSFQYFLEEVVHTFLIGTLLTVIFTISHTERLLRIHKKFAEQVSREPQPVTRDKTKLIIETNTESDYFSLTIDEFLFAKADGNYVEFFLLNKGVIDKKLCRITLTRVEAIFKDIQSVVKTHRAYLVNTLHVQKVEGNAQGLQLSLKKNTEKIPVSRRQIPIFKQVMNG
ncbi:LytTR family DNA-binding domain-containing protein [Zunongwangia sp. F363]|uniref:LytTR family DNA-binding domain-containing protein n=1 Tax=Autumnicola tepida TaxID=3075595 RepID=A0ABU3CCA6_9FLAO|nr:LytTR family DNA-binding domain-containing protein [Zunongwangia sp. F363]MDT0643965.1 LytTR family DNA-binding domain-containing protein [Zunongwangia sp. F363]